jgi:hypothetical protein
MQDIFTVFCGCKLKLLFTRVAQNICFIWKNLQIQLYELMSSVSYYGEDIPDKPGGGIFSIFVYEWKFTFFVSYWKQY